MAIKHWYNNDKYHTIFKETPTEPGWYVGVIDAPRKLYRMDEWVISRFDTSRLLLGNSIHVQGWMWNGCSSSAMYGWSSISLFNDAKVADFLIHLEEVYEKASNGYYPHRTFVQCPVGKEHGFGTVCRAVWGDLPKVAYRFDNRSHSSVEQRIYDVQIDEWFDWAKKFQRKQAEKDYHEQTQKQVAAIGVSLGRNGVNSRPIAAGEFVPAR